MSSEPGNGLVGLIWESEDRFDHLLLSYDTDRDYSRTTLSFRWQSEGYPAAGCGAWTDAHHRRTRRHRAARTWYVRLWNYADGAPDDATVTLPFSQLREGWLADGAAVEPAEIDRMFISLVAPAFDPASSGLAARAAGGLSRTDRDPLRR